MNVWQEKAAAVAARIIINDVKQEITQCKCTDAYYACIWLKQADKSDSKTLQTANCISFYVVTFLIVAKCLNAIFFAFKL